MDEARAGLSGVSVGDLGEAALIALLRERLPVQSPELIMGIGDDAAVLRPTARPTVATVDAAVEGEDFLTRWPCGYETTGRDVGFKSAAQNLSDINAMGAIPATALLVLALTGETPAKWVSDYADGFATACERLGATDLAVAGGDLSKARVLLASVSMTGSLPGPALLRSGAAAGDGVYVVGECLGRADVSLGLLASSRTEDHVSGWGAREERVSRGLFEPLPPLAAGPALAGHASAAMDISDGLVRDASRLAAASAVGIDLDSEALRAELAVLREWGGRHVTRGLDHVLYGGEDHLLLFTLPESAGHHVPEGARRIGTVTDGSGMTLEGRSLDPSAGFDHFA